MSGAPLRTPPGVGIDHLLRRPASLHAERIALCDDAGAISYGDAEDAANRLARWLTEPADGMSRARKGDRVAIILPNAIPFIIAELALLRLALVKVPLNIRFAAAEVLYALGDCAPTVLVATPGYCRQVLARRQEIPSLRTFICVGERVPGTTDWRDIVEGPPAAPV